MVGGLHQRTPWGRTRAERTERAAMAITLVGVLLALVVGLQLRIDNTPDGIIPAEDPYTHMALTRDHLDDGRIDPLSERESLYPPGFHAVAATIHSFTGLEMHLLFLWLPAAFGALGVLGAAALARPLGRPATIVAAFGYAVAPELVFRTTMMAPTALDLALLPWILHAFIRMLEGRLGWAAVAAPSVLLLVFAHPWVVAFTAAAAFLLLLLLVALPWHAPRPSLLGVLLGAAILGAATGLTITGCDGSCGPGVLRISGDHTQGAGTGHDGAIGWSLVAASLALPLAARSNWVRRNWHHVMDGHRPRWFAAAIAGTLGIGTFILWDHASAQGLPEFVDPDAMFGRTVLVLAAAGLVAAPFWRHPVSQVAVAWTVLALPLVLLNPFDSPFWPHRTAAYLAIGLVLLAAVAVETLVATTAGLVRALRGASPGAAVAALTVTGLTSLALVTTAPTAHAWYQLYDDCESEALRSIGTSLPDDALAVTGAWQSKLIVAAYAPDPESVWFVADLFSDRFQTDASGIAKDRPVFLIADPRTEGAPEDPAAASYCGGTVTVHPVEAA